MVIRLLIFSIYILLFTRCGSKDDTPTSTPANHIEYFGFTLVDTDWDDPTDTETKSNFNDEVAPFSNMADILVVGPTDAIVDRMKAMELLQMKSVLHLNELFFEINGTEAPSGINYQLRSDAFLRWDTFIAANSLVQNEHLVQALYIGEEPTWNGISFSELKQVTDYVKTTVPELPIMVVEAYPSLNDLQIPASVDWVGFDHYFIKDPKNDSTFTSELNVLKSKLSEEQKLVLIMDTHYIGFAHGDFGGTALDEMADVAHSYYELAKSESKTIAILGYFWPSGFDDIDAIGARHMPDAVLQEYRRIGKEITAK